MQEYGVVFGTRQAESGKATRRLSARFGEKAEAGKPLRRFFFEVRKQETTCYVAEEQRGMMSHVATRKIETVFNTVVALGNNIPCGMLRVCGMFLLNRKKYCRREVSQKKPLVCKQNSG